MISIYRLILYCEGFHNFFLPQLLYLDGVDEEGLPELLDSFRIIEIEFLTLFTHKLVSEYPLNTKMMTVTYLMDDTLCLAKTVASKYSPMASYKSTLSLLISCILSIRCEVSYLLLACFTIQCSLSYTQIEGSSLLCLVMML